MASVVDINIFCYKILDKEILEMLLNKYGVHVKSIMSMKNWMWEDEQDIGGRGSGVETEFVYSEDVVSIIQNSHNVVFWIEKDTLINDSVRSIYIEREMGSGMVALESVKLDIEEEKDLLDDIGDE